MGELGSGRLEGPLRDGQGNAVANATPEAIALLDRALDALNVYRGDPLALAEAAIEVAPRCAMAHILKTYLFALATEPEARAEAARIVETLRSLDLAEREASHAAALAALVRGDWTEAAERLARHNADHPRDLLAIQGGHLVDFYRASARDLRDRIARVLPQWSANVPGYPVVLGMYAFGLEEAGDYGRAEEFGREAVTLDARDAWAHHAVAHVMEMQGRAEDGIGWMSAREPHWASDGNFMRTHNAWHRALYHLDLEDTASVLALYDGPIRGDRSGVALDLVDASALLWRLHLTGCDVGDRWIELAAAWDAHADGDTYPFNDWHAVMAYLGADREGEVERVLAALRQPRYVPVEVTRWGRQTAIPLIEGFAAFWRGDYAEAVDALMGARNIANSFGGSHAQRDVIDWTITEAALRGGVRGVATALANERVALKPHSPVNRAFLRRAAALGEGSQRAAH